jgi:hypothetical protein
MKTVWFGGSRQARGKAWLQKDAGVRSIVLFGLLLGIVAGCEKAPDEKEKAEAARVAQEVRDSIRRKIDETDTKKKEEQRCWQHPEEAYRLACQYVQDAYPSAADAEFPASPDKVEKQIDRHLLIRGHYVGKDETGRAIQVTWEATAYINGKWQILCSEVVSTRLL